MGLLKKMPVADASRVTMTYPMADGNFSTSPNGFEQQSKNNMSHAPLERIRSSLGKQAGVLILYLAVMELIGPPIAAILIMVLQVMKYEDVSADFALFDLNSSLTGVLSLISVSAAFVFWIVVHKRQFSDPTSMGIFHRSEQHMTPWVFLGAIGLLCAAQSITTVYNVGFSWVVDYFDTQVSTSGEVIEAASGTLAMFIYSSFFAPIVEEIVFRGVIMKALVSYGKVFAIVTSSVMFGFFHADVTQGFFAFFAGLILGYLASEYSIFWSIFFHIFNNLVLSDIGTLAVRMLPLPMQDLVGIIGLAGGLVLGLLVIFLGRVRIRNFIVTNRACKDVYASWLNFWFVFFIALQVLSTAIAFHA